MYIKWNFKQISHNVVNQMFTKALYNCLSGSSAGTERYVAWHLKKIKLQIEEKIRNWKKKSSWLKLSWPLWFVQWIKSELVCRIWCLFCLSFFGYNFLCDESKEWREIQFLNVFCPGCKRGGVKCVTVSLQPSSGESFSSLALLFSLLRSKPMMPGGCYTAQANLLGESLQTS